MAYKIRERKKEDEIKLFMFRTSSLIYLNAKMKSRAFCTLATYVASV